MEFSLGVFANEEVGNKTINYLFKNFKNDLKFVVCTNKHSVIYKTLIGLRFDKNKIYLNDDLKSEDTILTLKSYNVNIILLAWWPYIVKKNILDIPKIGVLNFHPSLLPYNRGRNYNFWTIVENTPFGVTIHFVDEKVDTGDIVFQRVINKDWTDTGRTLYVKAKEAIFNLFIDKYKEIKEGKYKRVKQDDSIKSFRLAKEMDIASKIHLDNIYSARNLINLLRAKSFPPHPGIWFEEDGVKYEMFINIKKLSNNIL